MARTTGEDGIWMTILGDISGASEVEVEEFGDWVGTLIPDPVKRNRILKRGFGVLKNRLEKFGYSTGGVKGEVLRRLTDVLDFALQDNSHGKGAAGRKIEAWLADLMEDGQKRFLAAQPGDKAAVLAAVTAEIEMYRAFYEAALGAREELGKPPMEHRLKWGQIDSWLGQLSRTLETRYSSLRPTTPPPSTTDRYSKRVAVANTSRYLQANQTSGLAAIAGTGVRAVEVAGQRVTTGIRAVAIGGLAIFLLIVVSLAGGWESGLGLSLALVVLAISAIVIAWPKISVAIGGLALWKGGTRTFWTVRAIARVVGLLMLFMVLFMWWDPQWDVRWRYTIVLVVFAAVLMGLAMGKSHGTVGGHGGKKDGGLLHETLKLMIVLVLAAAFLIFSIWRVDKADEANRAKEHYRTPAYQGQ